MRHGAPSPEDVTRHRSTVDAPAGGAQPGASRPARILVVEDDYFVALELEYLLLAAEFIVVGVAATAEEALDIAAVESPDLAIMDIRLAGVRDGVEAAGELFAKLGIRSIFATAHVDRRTRQRAEPVQPLGWLQKPYSAESLLTTVRAALAQST